MKYLNNLGILVWFGSRGTQNAPGNRMALIEKIFNPLSSFHHKRISKYLSKLDIEKIIDIGAHKGEFLESMLKIEKVNSFYAFEPQKNIFKELDKKFSVLSYSFII